MINGVSVVISIVLGICPAANNIVDMTLAITYILTGIFSLSLQKIFEITKTINDIINSLSITSSITPPANNPLMIFGKLGVSLYRPFTQLLNEPKISLSPGYRRNAEMMVIIDVATTASLSYLNSFHSLTFFDMPTPMAASATP